ncbi:MAG: (2Fe-2S) ferredoxin domain-containing protein [Microscillaceae bacterium]|jgi:NADH:ubiquinone oxidoreductase subunit E|nr:(2Fe-2S) ferredoxin domain-containing protein [Microscillaceae bacterium]
MKKPHTPTKIIYLCVGDKCKQLGNKELAKQLKEKVKEIGLKHSVEIVKTECLGRCKFAPVGSIQPANEWFHQLNPKELKKIFSEAIEEDDA